MNGRFGARTVIFSLERKKKIRYIYFVSTLYIVATPIGNLGDITLRAIETFKNADVIACEDTRRTLRLLNHLEISKPLLSCRARNEREASQKVVRLLNDEKNIAYASDAGTPALSDPGAVLVNAAREAGHAIVPIPGASAFSTLLSAAGGFDKTVVFEGFLSPKAGRRRSRLAELMNGEAACVLYESPYRIVKLLADIADIDGKRVIVVGRELTKLHEEILQKDAISMYELFAARQTVKGEFAIYVSGGKTLNKTDADADI